jgi:hypothetical protein
MVSRDLDYIKVYRIRAVIRGLDQEYGLIEVMGTAKFPNQRRHSAIREGAFKIRTDTLNRQDIYDR